MVKVGTAIDPELDGELRVTLVATGLQRTQVAHASARRNTPQVVLNNEQPHAQQKQPTQQGQRSATKGNTAVDLDFLNIPTFLRQQAD